MSRFFFWHLADVDYEQFFGFEIFFSVIFFFCDFSAEVFFAVFFSFCFFAVFLWWGSSPTVYSGLSTV